MNRYKDLRIFTAAQRCVRLQGVPLASNEAHRTQVWLAVSDQPEALVTGEYFYHLRRKGTLSAAHDVARQDRLLAICERLSGIALPG